MKMCMIGDSHLAMMVSAYKEQPLEGLEIVPVSWLRHLGPQVRIDGSSLYADGAELTDFWNGVGLPSRIELAEYDALTFVSFSATLFSVLAILRDHAVSGWNGTKPIIKALNSPLGNPSRRRLITPAVFSDSLSGIMRDNYTYKFIEQIRGVSDIPIMMVPAPLPRELILSHRPNLQALKRILHAQDGGVVAQSLQHAHETTYGAFDNVTVLRQPQETIVHGCLTKEKYRVGASRYGTGVEHDDDDILHAGPLLGQIFLNKISELCL